MEIQTISAQDVSWIADLGLTSQERELLATMLDPTTDFDATTHGLSPDALWKAIGTSIKVYSLTKKAQAQLKPVIGKLLIALQDHPELYHACGYRTFDDFISRGCSQIFGLPRSEAYRSKRLVEAWSNLSPLEFAEVGESKLYLLSSFTNSHDPASSKWLERAKTHTLDQLKDEIVSRGEAPSLGSLHKAHIDIIATATQKRAWNQFASNPEVHSFVGSADPGAILDAMMSEAMSSWGIKLDQETGGEAA